VNIEDLRNIRCLILDVDGVIWSGDSVIPGSAQALNSLRSTGKCIRLLTNDAISSRSARIAEMATQAIHVDLDEMFTATYLAAEYLRYLGKPPSLVLLDGEGLSEFTGLSLVQTAPEVVVVGDYFDSYDRRTLDEAFYAVINGAPLLAMQRNRYFMSGDRPRIDAGFWVAGLEYCTGIRAKVIGKPSVESYEMVLRRAGFSPQESAMVSDDLYSDLLGAKKAGLTTIHIQSGDQSVPHIETLPADLTVTSLLHLSRLIASE
jgi:HAD superfamily hydrolase (TIGR01458 family)